HLNPARAEMAIEDNLEDYFDLEPVGVAKLIKQSVDHNMANGIATELRSRGFDPRDFTLLAYGGNGPLHCCSIASALSMTRVLAPPFASVFSALGAGNVNQMHIHEASTYTVLYHTGSKHIFTDFERLNSTVEELEARGRNDLLRQGMAPEDIRFRHEFDMRYGNQRVETAVTALKPRFERLHDILELIGVFHQTYGARFGEGSQATESGVRINTIRVTAYVELDKVHFGHIKPVTEKHKVEATGSRQCHFVGHDDPVTVPVYDESALAVGTYIEGPAIVTTSSTTYLVEPGWSYHASNHGAVWFNRLAANSQTAQA
ncbi:MAG: hydantoinase/oxoprolinase family protein, partial [Gammaproteobacteria bacterium]